MTVDGCILKPVQRPPKGEREVVFYETIFDEKEEREEILQLRRFLPRYYGVVEIGSLAEPLNTPSREVLLFFLIYFILLDLPNLAGKP